MSESSSRPSSPADAAAVVVAGGSGSRMGPGAPPKQFQPLGGEPLLARTLRPFLEHPAVGQVIVVLPAEQAAGPPPWLRALPVTLVAGGAERGDSVWNGLQALNPGVRVVLIHDGARPLVTAEVIDRVLAAARTGAVVAAVPVTDTLKEVDAEGRVVATPDRNRFWQAQTPQGFPAEMILSVHRQARAAGTRGTDDAALCEMAGIAVKVVEGDHANLKVTRPHDLRVAEALHSLRGGPGRGGECRGGGEHIG